MKKSNNNYSEKIPFTHPAMFALVMQNEEICLGLLRLILPEEDFVEVRKLDDDFMNIGKAEGDEDGKGSIITEATLKFSAKAHGVRFDAYAKSKNAWAEIEMQTYKGWNLAKRSRYYQANMDIDALNQGIDYDKLPRSYVIFICTYDYMEKGEPVYYFRNYDVKNNLNLGDESYKIILNTKCEPEKVPKELKPLFDYIENRSDKDEEGLVAQIDSEVVKYSGSDWRWNLMTLEEIMKWEYADGHKVGVEEGRKSGLEEGRKSGLEEGRISMLAELIKDATLTVAEAAQKAGISESEIIEYMKAHSAE